MPFVHSGCVTNKIRGVWFCAALPPGVYSTASSVVYRTSRAGLSPEVAILQKFTRKRYCNHARPESNGKHLGSRSPSHFSATTVHKNFFLERKTGVEPASPAWKAGILAVVLLSHIKTGADIPHRQCSSIVYVMRLILRILLLKSSGKTVLQDHIYTFPRLAVERRYRQHKRGDKGRRQNYVIEHNQSPLYLKIKPGSQGRSVCVFVW